MSIEATIISLVLMGVFLVLSAFFSSSETAFISLQRIRILHLVNIGQTGAKRLYSRIDQPEKTLSTVLLGNNLVNTAMAAVGTMLAVAWLDRGVAVVVSTAGVTILLLILGEVVPKTFASRHSEWLAFRYIRPFAVFELLLFPFAILIRWIGTAVVNLTGGRSRGSYQVSEELLRSVISIGQSEGAVESDEAIMLNKVLNFGDRLVKEVMTPRTEIAWVEEDTTLSEFLDIYDQAPRSRFPMYKENMDNVVGILHTSDAIRAMHKGDIEAGSNLIHLVRPARFVPETKQLDGLFEEMQTTGIHMVLTVDEHGGIAGLVTMQQLVGAITGWTGEDEQAPSEEVESLGQGTFQVDAGMQIEEANERLNLSIPDGEYETIAGFLLDQLGHIPMEGEAVRHGSLTLTVSEMSGVKIEKILMTKQRREPASIEPEGPA